MVKKEKNKAKTKGEKSFTEWAQKNKPNPKRQKKAIERKLAQFQRKAESTEKLNEIYPEFQPPEVEGKPIQNFQASWQQGKKVNLIKSESMKLISYERKHNPNLMLLFNFSSAKVYYNIDTFDYWLYIFSTKRNQILRKILIEKHDLFNMLAFSLAEIYGKNLLKQKRPEIRVTKKLREKIEGIFARIELVERGKLL